MALHIIRYLITVKRKPVRAMNRLEAMSHCVAK